MPFPFVDQGILDETQLAALYASATVGLVLSSTNPSLMPPEMMAAGCAVVDLDLPPNHFLVEHGRTGLLATPEPQALADTICQLLEDAALHERLVSQARAAVAPLSWAHSARQVEAALIELAPPTLVPAPHQLDLDQAASDATTPALSAQLTVGQRCLPRHDGLCRIAVGRSAPGGDTPTLRIYEAAATETLLYETSAAHDEAGWLVYEFPPIPATGGRGLYFTLAAAAGPELRFTYRPAPGTSLTYNGVPQVGQLMYRTWFQPPLGSDAVTASDADELDTLYTRQRMAADEQELVGAYVGRLHQAAVQPSVGRGWTERGRYAAQLLRTGAWPRLLREAALYVRWRRAAAPRTRDR